MSRSTLFFTRKMSIGDFLQFCTWEVGLNQSPFQGRTVLCLYNLKGLPSHSILQCCHCPLLSIGEGVCRNLLEPGPSILDSLQIARASLGQMLSRDSRKGSFFSPTPQAHLREWPDPDGDKYTLEALSMVCRLSLECFSLRGQAEGRLLFPAMRQALDPINGLQCDVGIITSHLTTDQS